MTGGNTQVEGSEAVHVPHLLSFPGLVNRHQKGLF